MKKLNRKKGRFALRASTVILLRLLVAASALAVEPPHQDPELLQALHDTRLKQEDEEGKVVRVIQQPVAVSNDVACSPAEMARQRLRDLGLKEGKNFGAVNVAAGHTEVKVDNNSGQVNNSVNVQVVAPNDRKCF